MLYPSVTIDSVKERGRSSYDILLALKGKDFSNNGIAVTLLAPASDGITAPFDPQAIRMCPTLNFALSKSGIL